jgi:3-deoxy-D-manno-octulosonic-acid transferase
VAALLGGDDARDGAPGDARGAGAPPTGGKLARTFRARHGLVPRLVSQARAVRDPTRPLLWFHAPSVGEGLQARPVIEALRAARADVQVAYTFFSPSAERFAATIGAEITGYLPFDRARHADALLDALTPSALVFAKLDVWPLLVARAAARGVPVALLSGTLAAGSGRLGWLSRQLLRDAYASLAVVGAIDAANGERLAALGARRAVVRVTGDTRFDQVAARAARADRDGPLLAPLLALVRAPLRHPVAGFPFTLVAGSTWPADEAVLLPAWRAFRAAHPGARLVVAPHEPTPAHLAPIERWAADAGLALTRLSAVMPAAGASAGAAVAATEPAADATASATAGEMAGASAGAAARSATAHAAAATPPDIVLVDRVGVLGDLYALADVAFVGGGFHAAGLHSVIEPAAFGAPVLFGPRHDSSRDAGLLLDAGAARVVRTAADLADALATWADAPEARHAAGNAARAVVRREQGATGRTLAMVLEVLPTEDQETGDSRRQT